MTWSFFSVFTHNYVFAFRFDKTDGITVEGDLSHFNDANQNLRTQCISTLDPPLHIKVWNEERTSTISIVVTD